MPFFWSFAPLFSVVSLAVFFFPCVSADYLITHMYPGAACEGNESAVSISPSVECSVNVGGQTSSSATCVDSTLAVVTEWPTPNCTGTGSNNSVPLGLCTPEWPEISVESVSCHRGPPSSLPGVKATYIQRAPSTLGRRTCAQIQKRLQSPPSPSKLLGLSLGSVHSTQTSAFRAIRPAGTPHSRFLKKETDARAHRSPLTSIHRAVPLVEIKQ